MSSRIEQIIEEIEEYIDRDCKFQPLSQTKIIVNKEHHREPGCDSGRCKSKSRCYD